mmetsp:Transcript_11830/g.20007  ORF Transcript_11830/g.20007 Transcript_11830/m.20007 type:complete len:128 (-) Transcript_11830:88-471(-)
MGYTFNLDDVKGIKYRENQEGGILMMIYTCAVKGCNTKQARTFSKTSYKHGVVLLRCEGCNNLHLIADNMGWFSENGLFTGKSINIETILKQKGEHVHKFISDQGFEFINEQDDETPGSGEGDEGKK